MGFVAQHILVARGVPEAAITYVSLADQAVAANLAMVMAQSGKRVAVIDADMRRPKIGRELGDQFKVPLMVHVSFAPPETPEVMELLRAGDVLIQRGTRHSWSVRGNEPCIVAAVLVGAALVAIAERVPGVAAPESRAGLLVSIVALGLLVALTLAVPATAQSPTPPRGTLFSSDAGSVVAEFWHANSGLCERRVDSADLQHW